MTTSIDQTFYELFDIFSSGASYVPLVKKSDIVTSDVTSDASVEAIQKQLISLLDGKNNVDDINDNIISEISQIFNQIFSSVGMKVDFSNFGKYLKYFAGLPQTPCTHFVDQSDIANNLNDDDHIPIDILFKGMSCKTCGLLKETHKVCSKYIQSDVDDMFSDCDTCGLAKYGHTICDKFCINPENEISDCMNCGCDLRRHQDKEIKNGIYPCQNFIETRYGCLDCMNCIHTRTYHMLNPRLFKMNSDAFDKFTTLAFGYNCDFIGLSDSEKQQKMNQFYKVLCMNYSSNHPMYSTFNNTCNNTCNNTSNDGNSLSKVTITLV